MHVAELCVICESLHLPKNAAVHLYIDPSSSSSAELCDSKACHLVDYILIGYS